MCPNLYSARIKHKINYAHVRVKTMPVIRTITFSHSCQNTAQIKGIYVKLENGPVGTPWCTDLTWSAECDDVVFFQGITSAKKYTCTFSGKAGHVPNQLHTVYHVYYNSVCNTVHWRKKDAPYLYWDNIWFRVQDNKYVDFLHDDAAFKFIDNLFIRYQLGVTRELQTDTQNAIALINTYLSNCNATSQNIFNLLDFVKSNLLLETISLPAMLKLIHVRGFCNWTIQWKAYTDADKPISKAESAKFYTLFFKNVALILQHK